MKTSLPLYIIGAGGHARVVIDAAQVLGYTVAGILDTDFHGQEERIFGVPVVGGLEILDTLENSSPVFAAAGDNAKRKILFQDLVHRGFETRALIHPSAVVSKHAAIGRGVFINAGAVIQAGASIGENSIINTGACIDHETVIGPHSHVAPGAHVAGRVKAGESVFIGIGASIVDKITIGSRVVVGAGAAVIGDVPDGVTVAGVPARELS